MSDDAWCVWCAACASVMNEIVGVTDDSCTDCDGPNVADCAVALCDTDYHTFVDGVGCSGIPHPSAWLHHCP
jgi:hypothetical protein